VFFFMMNSLGLYSKANLSICLLREVTLQELTVHWPKVEALSIDDLVGTIYVNLIDDINLEVNLPPILWVVIISLRRANT